MVADCFFQNGHSNNSKTMCSSRIFFFPHPKSKDKVYSPSSLRLARPFLTTPSNRKWWKNLCMTSKLGHKRPYNFFLTLRLEKCALYLWTTKWEVPMLKKPWGKSTCTDHTEIKRGVKEPQQFQPLVFEPPRHRYQKGNEWMSLHLSISNHCVIAIAWAAE